MTSRRTLAATRHSSGTPRRAHGTSASGSGLSGDLIDPQAFSSWRRLIRVTARIKRLAEKIRPRKHAQEGKQGPLTPDELLQAELFRIRDAQKGLHELLAKGEFKTLSPFIDDKVIIRVGGRLDKAIVSYETKLPAQFPTTNWISLLITRHMHQFGHPGVATTTAKISQQAEQIGEIPLCFL